MLPWSEAAVAVAFSRKNGLSSLEAATDCACRVVGALRTTTAFWDGDTRSYGRAVPTLAMGEVGLPLVGARAGGHERGE